MCPHSFRRLVRVTFDEYIDQVLVAARRLARGWLPCRTEPGRGKHMILFDRLAKRPATRALRDPAVKLFVQTQVKKSVSTRLCRERVDSRRQALHLGPLLESGDSGKQPRGFHFERFSHDIMSANILLGRNSDSRAGARPALEQTLIFQP